MSLRVAGLVLAAGASRRYGPRNKLIESFEGKALVAHVVDATLEAGLWPVHVVTGYDAHAVREALLARPVEFVHHPGHERGMGSSLAAGASSLGDVDAASVALGDMPRLRADHVQRIIEALEANHEEYGDQTLCVPTFDGRQGHPVVFGRAHLPTLSQLSGERGARGLIDARAGEIVEVPMQDAGVLLDIDRSADWGEAERG